LENLPSNVSPAIRTTVGKLVPSTTREVDLITRATGARVLDGDGDGVALAVDVVEGGAGVGDGLSIGEHNDQLRKRLRKQ
jgi:hypothetical protein